MKHFRRCILFAALSFCAAPTMVFAKVGFVVTKIEDWCHPLDSSYEVEIAIAADAPYEAWQLRTDTPWIRLLTIEGQGSTIVRIAVDGTQLSSEESVGSVILSANGIEEALPIEFAAIASPTSAMVSSPNTNRVAVLTQSGGKSGQPKQWLLTFDAGTGLVEAVAELEPYIYEGMRIPAGGDVAYLLDYESDVVASWNFAEKNVTGSLVLPDRELGWFEPVGADRFIMRDDAKRHPVEIWDFESGSIVAAILLNANHYLWFDEDRKLIGASQGRGRADFQVTEFDGDNLSPVISLAVKDDRLQRYTGGFAIPETGGFVLARAIYGADFSVENVLTQVPLQMSSPDGSLLFSYDVIWDTFTGMPLYRNPSSQDCWVVANSASDRLVMFDRGRFFSFPIEALKHSEIVPPELDSVEFDLEEGLARVSILAPFHNYLYIEYRKSGAEDWVAFEKQNLSGSGVTGGTGIVAEAGETYEVRARGETPNGLSSWNEWEFTVPWVALPFTIERPAKGIAHLTLDWEVPTGAVEVLIERREGTAATAQWIEVARFTDIAVNTFRDENITLGSEYTYRLTYRIGDLWSAPATRYSEAAQPYLVPATPSRPYVDWSSSTAISLWHDGLSFNTETFEVQYRPHWSPDAPWTSFGEFPAETPYVTVDSLDPETLYAFRVRALNPGGASEFSPFAFAATHNFVEIAYDDFTDGPDPAIWSHLSDGVTTFEGSEGFPTGPALWLTGQFPEAFTNSFDLALGGALIYDLRLPTYAETGDWNFAASSGSVYVEWGKEPNRKEDVIYYYNVDEMEPGWHPQVTSLRPAESTSSTFFTFISLTTPPGMNWAIDNFQIMAQRPESERDRWRLEVFGQTGNNGNAADNASVKRNIPNLVYYALGLDPWDSVSSYDPAAPTKGGWPRVTRSDSALTVEFMQRSAAADPDLQVKLEGSTDLEQWSEVPTVINSIPGTSDFEQRRATLESSSGLRFFRLVVE